jgi:molybdopterin-guanine dinucleotide biosynthesis protein A
MPELEGFILTGGASRRMGADKPRLVLGGRSFVARAAAALAAVAARISVVSARESDAGFGLPLVRDVFVGAGALGGLHAALLNCRAPWAAVVSCDLPFATGELFERLASLGGDEFDAVAPRQPDGRAQPLCALYARDACLRAADRLLRAGELRPRVLLAEVRTRWVAPDELADLRGSARFFTNVNTPADYALAVESERAADNRFKV